MNIKRVCKHGPCITILGKYSNPDYCHLHRTPDYRWNDSDSFFAGLREEGIPPRGNVTCTCGRVRKSTTSCLCAVTPAPKQPPWEFYRPGEAA